eukprot:gene3964-7901_t
MAIFFIFTLSILRGCHCFNLNATGGTFPQSVVVEATFSYQFVEPEQVITYVGTGSTTGKCNIMGYWHTGNVDPSTWSPSTSVKIRDTNICTDKCTVALCGNSSKRFDRQSRTPLVHFAISDALLSANDYKYFPDLQMFPAVAGAVVPIYNIPEIKNIGGTLILSRYTLSNIFLGNIRMWNDSNIIKENPELSSILSQITAPIKVAVRTDSSGTTSIFTTALSSFDPAGISSPDYSFAKTVTAGERPNWCGPKTDEIQIITTSNCPTSLNSTSKIILMNVIRTDKTLSTISFNCDDTPINIKTAFETVYGTSSILVSRKILNNLNTSYAYTIGYWGPSLTTINWYEPSLISTVGTVSVSISTLQEGSYWNSHFNSSAYFVTTESQSLFINTATNFTFDIINTNTPSLSTYTIDMSIPTTNLFKKIKTAFNTIAPYLITNIKVITSGSIGNQWSEFILSFNTTKPNPSKPKVFRVQTSASTMGKVAISTSLHAKNYPFFYDFNHPQGYGNSGRYTCYKHEHYMKPWDFYTGSGNIGVIAAVLSMPYSIGYSVLQDASQLSIPMASMINKAKIVVQANSNSVAFAVMEKGGNLDSRFNAELSDGTSSTSWPIVGYTYFVIRGNKHIGTCAQRTAIMSFLYNFYYSDTVKQIAARLGFTTLPNFIRDNVVNRLMDVAKCSDGTFALASYRQLKTPLLTVSAIKSTVNTYISAYYNIDPSTSWSMSDKDDSRYIWSTLISNPQKYTGAFTMFSSKTLKTNYFQQVSSNTMITTAFAHVAVIPIYHINAFTAKATGPLRITSDILAGIYIGTIKYWDDPIIQVANSENKKYLPHSRIQIVIRKNPCDVNEIFSRFLGMKSDKFRQVYGLPTSSSNGNNNVYEGNSSLSFHHVLDSNYTIDAKDNQDVDSAVTFRDNAIGYYLQVGTPLANIALYCTDAYCSGSAAISPANAASISNCQLDITNTAINIPSAGVISYDLMSSTASGCYPIIATIDYSTPATTDPTCPLGSSGIAYKRVQFSSWLFSGPTLTQPLKQLYAAGAPETVRALAYKDICDIQCGGRYLGYDYCDYRDCSWKQGDYNQIVSSCDAKKQLRTVTYELKNPDNDCIQNPRTVPPSSVHIDCEHLESNSSLGIACYILGIVGVFICFSILILSILLRNDTRMTKATQPVFVYLFLSGAIALNASIFVYIGPNTSLSCIIQPWITNLAISAMYGPIVMKLNTVDRLNKNPHLSKILTDPKRIFQEVFALLCIDLIILILYTTLETPVSIDVEVEYLNTLNTVTNHICNANMNQKGYIILIVYKAVLFLFGMVKAICTWHVTAEVSEAKQFAVAISVGGISYLIGAFLGFSASSTIIMRCITTFICATASTLLIMLPKFQTPVKSKRLANESSRGGLESRQPSQMCASGNSVRAGSPHGSPSITGRARGNGGIGNDSSNSITYDSGSAKAVSAAAKLFTSNSPKVIIDREDSKCDNTIERVVVNSIHRSSEDQGMAIASRTPSRQVAHICTISEITDIKDT